MCFLEYIGYTCGHISLPVLRSCPLTTASHTFPTCTRRGDKPFLAGEMCPACQKIVHSRATQIEEYEHRFMHERGVCGCETIFPHLIRPRTIGGGGELLCSDTINTDGAHVPPILCEALDVGGRSVVSVRLPSLYAAEWVADHRQRHDDGLCECRVDCQTYGEAVEAVEAVEEETGEAETEETEDEGVKNPIYLAPLPMHRRTASLSSMPPDELTELRSTLRYHRRRSSHGPFLCSSGIHDDWAELRAIGVSNPPATVRPASVGTTASTVVTGYEAQPAGKGKPVRYSGAVFAKVPAYLPLTGPFLARPTPRSGGSASHVPVVDGVLTKHSAREGSMASRIQHHVTLAMEHSPLLGYPVGAGPEGVPHAAPWQGQPSCWTRC